MGPLLRGAAPGRLLAALFAASLLTPALAQGAVSRAQLEDLEHHLWQIRTNFHMYSAMDQDGNYRDALNQAVDGAGEALSALADSAEGDAEQQLVSELESTWDGWAPRQALDQAEEGDQDAVEEPVAAMASRLDDYADAEEGDHDDVRRLMSQLQEITSVYAQVVDSDGQAAQDGLKAGMDDFEQELEAVLRRHGGEPDLGRSLDQAKLKWQFIRGSMLKFNDEAVPYLIYRYTSRMTEDLEQAIELSGDEAEKPTIGPPD